MSAELIALMRQAMERVQHLPNVKWQVNATARRVLRRKFLRFRKEWPSPIRFSRKVHRAYKKVAR